ncbi:MAG: response regulator [Nitrospirae bacterium]|nr:response regulator [Nitrospirota bacterium]
MPAARSWILYVEDNEDDVRLAREFLPVAQYPVAWAPDAQAARERLAAERFDLILLDHGLPDSNSLRLLDDLRRDHPATPVIILTGREDEVLEVSVLKKGAERYLLKDRMREELLAVVTDTLGARQDAPRTDRRKGIQARYVGEASQRVHAALLATMNEGCVLVDVFGIVTFANEAAGRMLGVSTGDLLGRNVADLFDAPTGKRVQAFRQEVADSPLAGPVNFEGRLRNPVGNGARGRSVLVSGSAVHTELGKYEACLLVVTDISELVEVRMALQLRLGEMERLQKFFLERENAIIMLKSRIAEYERRLGVQTPGLSDETRRELERRLAKLRPST